MMAPAPASTCPAPLGLQSPKKTLVTAIAEYATPAVTINGSTITAGAGVGRHEIDALVNGTAVQCLNVFGNTLDSGAGTINLDELGATSAINVTQGSAALLGTLNGIPAGNVTTSGDNINFNQPACPTP